MPAKPELSHIQIERVRPQVDCGRYRAKAVIGDRVAVVADIFRDGTAQLAATVRSGDPAPRGGPSSR
ncbi:MAG TPA: maltotransferase domain-containing protein [Actinomycetota bacterium]|nr:maltotransferase domain-containing protein [Actinomycetota bacterium]